MKVFFVLRALLLGPAFCGGLLACALVMQRLLPRTAVPVVDEKQSRLLAKAGEFDTVFIGSSRVYHQFIPEQFDAAMRAAGQPTSSFNYGVDGLLPPESFFATDDLLRHRPRLRWVFIELAAIQPDFPRHYADTVRAWWWHDWTHTLLVLRANFRDGRMKGAAGLAMLQTHARLMVNYYLRLGRGAELLSARSRPRRSKKAPTALHEKRYAIKWIGAAGFTPLSEATLSGAAARQFQEGVDGFRATPFSAVLAPEMRKRLRELVAAVQAIGARPVFIITPSLDAREKIGDLRAQGIDADLLAFNDAAAFPSLYEPAVRADSAHLNAAGAREFTRLLAERFAARGRPTAP